MTSISSTVDHGHRLLQPLTTITSLVDADIFSKDLSHATESEKMVEQDQPVNDEVVEEQVVVVEEPVVVPPSSLSDNKPAPLTLQLPIELTAKVELDDRSLLDMPGFEKPVIRIPWKAFLDCVDGAECFPRRILQEPKAPRSANSIRVDAETVIPASVFKGMMKLGKKAERRAAHRFVPNRKWAPGCEGGRGILRSTSAMRSTKLSSCQTTDKQCVAGDHHDQEQDVWKQFWREKVAFDELDDLDVKQVIKACVGVCEV